MRINHNSLALNASDNLAKITGRVTKSMARLSSGAKIITPDDDAAGLAISSKMSAQIRGLDRAAQNSNDGISVIQSAEGGLGEIHSILSRMRELAVRAANDVEFEDDRDAIQEEFNSLREEIDQITETTAFNEQKLLNGDLNRRTLSSSYKIQTTYISSAVTTGEYNLEVVAEGEKAVYATGMVPVGAISEQEAGTIRVNGFSVSINEGMSMKEVYGTLQEHLQKIGISVMASADGGATEGKFGLDPVYFISSGYGSDEKISIEVSNDFLGNKLGVADGDEVKGKDCVANLKPSEKGFSKTATLTTSGNDIRVLDKNGFEMKLEVAPGGESSTTIEVLTAGSMIIQMGANSGEQLSIDIPSLDCKSLEIDNLNLYTHQYASDAISAIDEAVKYVSNVRSYLGACENRLEDVYDNLQIQEESITAAYSRIMDTDMAEEMTNYTQQEVLSQAAISMIKKSNERPESILQLLQ